MEREDPKGTVPKFAKDTNCKHEFVLVDIYTITDKKLDPGGKILFSKKIGKIYTFACKYCLDLQQKTFYFAGGEKEKC